VQKEQCFSLGKITKLHGYKGGLILHIDSSTPQFFKDLESVLLDINQELVPFFLSRKGKLNGKKLLIYLEDVRAEDAHKYVGRKVYLPESMLPKTEEDSYYDKAIIGYTAWDGEIEIGEVVDVVENSSQNLFIVEKDEQELLIPAVDAFIESIDSKQKIIYLELPEGLLDL
jgi:16S rRNA processing protein RimM